MIASVPKHLPNWKVYSLFSFHPWSWHLFCFAPGKLPTSTSREILVRLPFREWRLMATSSRRNLRQVTLRLKEPAIMSLTSPNVNLGEKIWSLAFKSSHHTGSHDELLNGVWCLHANRCHRYASSSEGIQLGSSSKICKPINNPNHCIKFKWPGVVDKSRLFHTCN